MQKRQYPGPGQTCGQSVLSAELAKLLKIARREFEKKADCGPDIAGKLKKAGERMHIIRKNAADIRRKLEG